MSDQAVTITLYRWAGQWGPFKVGVPCGDCALTKDVIKDTLANELKEVAVTLAVRDWLGEWWKPLTRGGWHAPIVMVEGRVVSQGHALNRGVLTEAVIEAHARRTPVTGTRLFGKRACPHCQRAKAYLDEANLAYRYHDVVREPVALYEMLARVKPMIGARTPITVPQIWIDGAYVGGADQLGAILHRPVAPNRERGQCSLSPRRLTATAPAGPARADRRSARSEAPNPHP